MNTVHNEFDDLAEKIDGLKDVDPFFKRFVKKMLAGGKRLTNGDAESTRLNGEVLGQLALFMGYHVVYHHAEPRDWRVMLAKEFGRWIIVGAVVVLCVWLCGGIVLTIYGHGETVTAERRAVMERVAK